MPANAVTGDMRPQLATISVKYRHIDGQHVFTSEHVRGLYVASADAREAFDTVAPVVAELIQLKTGMKCRAEMAATFDEFLAAAKNPTVVPPPLILANREVVIRCEA